VFATKDNLKYIIALPKVYRNSTRNNAAHSLVTIKTVRGNFDLDFRKPLFLKNLHLHALFDFISLKHWTRNTKLHMIKKNLWNCLL